jgi:hypothetical protein
MDGGQMKPPKEVKVLRRRPVKKTTYPTEENMKKVVVLLKKYPYQREKLSSWIAHHGAPYCPSTPCRWCIILFGINCPCVYLGYKRVAQVVRRLLKASK